MVYEILYFCIRQRIEDILRYRCVRIGLESNMNKKAARWQRYASNYTSHPVTCMYCNWCIGSDSVCGGRPRKRIEDHITLWTVILNNGKEPMRVMDLLATYASKSYALANRETRHSEFPFSSAHYIIHLVRFRGKVGWSLYCGQFYDLRHHKDSWQGQGSVNNSQVHIGCVDDGFYYVEILIVRR